MENNCTCASFFTVRGVHKEDCAAYVPEATSSEWEERFDRRFIEENGWEGENAYTKNVAVGNIKDFIREIITRTREEAFEEGKKVVVEHIKGSTGSRLVDDKFYNRDVHATQIEKRPEYIVPEWVLEEALALLPEQES